MLACTQVVLIIDCHHVCTVVVQQVVQQGLQIPLELSSVARYPAFGLWKIAADTD